MNYVQVNGKVDEEATTPATEQPSSPPPLVTPQVSVELPKDVPMLDSPLDFSRARSLKRGACMSVSSDTGDDASAAGLLAVDQTGRR